jgi:hypothetical protein
MIEGLSNVITPKLQAQVSEGEPDETVESVALAGATAIQRLIADRDSHRNCANAQKRDLVALSAINEDLHRRIAVIRHHYVELGTRMLTQLEQFDGAIRDAMQDNQHAAPAPSEDEDTTLTALAHRFKPTSHGPRSRSTSWSRP